MSDKTCNESEELRRILDEGTLYPVFQPIIDFRAQAILGYEALIRGPEDSPLHRPDRLFAVPQGCIEDKQFLGHANDIFP